MKKIKWHIRINVAKSKEVSIIGIKAMYIRVGGSSRP